MLSDVINRITLVVHTDRLAEFIKTFGKSFYKPYVPLPAEVRRSGENNDKIKSNRQPFSQIVQESIK